jgi:hypothetical protein
VGGGSLERFDDEKGEDLRQRCERGISPTPCGVAWARSLVWLEHPADNREVVGSNPTGPIDRQRIGPPFEGSPARFRDLSAGLRGVRSVDDNASVNGESDRFQCV